MPRFYWLATSILVQPTLLTIHSAFGQGVLASGHPSKNKKTKSPELCEHIPSTGIQTQIALPKRRQMSSDNRLERRSKTMGLNGSVNGGVKGCSVEKTPDPNHRSGAGAPSEASILFERN